MVTFFGKTISYSGNTVVSVEIGDFTVFILIGCVLSIFTTFFLPHIIVWAERICSLIALLSAAAMLLPLPSEAMLTAMYTQYFLCCFMTGFEGAIIMCCFTERTAVLYLTVVNVITNVIIGALHNDFIEFDFLWFRVFAVIALLLMVFFFFRLPGNVWPRLVKKSDEIKAPKRMILSILLWLGMSCFVFLFGRSVAMSVNHGVTILYLSSSLCGLIVYLIWRFYGIEPFRSFSVLTAVGAMGFLLAVASLYFPILSLPACAFLGVGSMCALFSPLLGLVLFKRYPSRIVPSMFAAVAFVTTLINYILNKSMRSNLTVLYICYLIIAVALAILYLTLQPYLSYVFRGRITNDITKLVNDNDDDVENTSFEVAEKVGPSVSGDETEAALKNTSLSVLRMRNLSRIAVSPLTRREYQVVDLMTQGLQQQQIADELGIRSSTVITHRNNAYSKLGVSNKQELFRKADYLSG
ncbi:MAG: LuxR C-terminal-related transcriptional regulator [Eubacterium sp.]|nr:LuxR C-terminal-related transcriptional regulator [Eubacterium sp.]